MCFLTFINFLSVVLVEIRHDITILLFSGHCMKSLPTYDLEPVESHNLIFYPDDRIVHIYICLSH